MKRVWKIGLIIGLLLLDWVALDDITTGNEPSYWGEYAILVISGVVFGILAWQWKKKRLFN